MFGAGVLTVCGCGHLPGSHENEASACSCCSGAGPMGAAAILRSVPFPVEAGQLPLPLGGPVVRAAGFTSTQAGLVMGGPSVPTPAEADAMAGLFEGTRGKHRPDPRATLDLAVERLRDDLSTVGAAGTISVFAEDVRAVLGYVAVVERIAAITDPGECAAALAALCSAPTVLDRARHRPDGEAR